jgi:transcriptional regulator with XRE-family HTH domain
VIVFYYTQKGEIDMFFSKNLRYLRKNAGHSQEFLSDYLGYKNYTTIQKWESGSSEPPLNVVAKLSELYNVSMDDLANVDIEKERFVKTNPKQEHPSAMFKREGLKVLFSAAEDLDDESIKFLQDMANKLKGN